MSESKLTDGIANMQVLSEVEAIQLNGTHRGRIATFDWRFRDSGLAVVLIGEIREVHHDAEGATIWLAPHDQDAGCLADFLVSHSTKVTVMRR